MKLKSTHELRPWALVAYFIFFGAAAAIAIATQNPHMRVVPVEAVLPGFYTHVSNLLISAALILVFGMLRMVYGGKISQIAIFALIVILANYIYEGFLTLYNTKDLVDAHYGTASTLVTFVLFVVIKRCGLKPAREPGRRPELRETPASNTRVAG